MKGYWIDVKYDTSAPGFSTESGRFGPFSEKRRAEECLRSMVVARTITSAEISYDGK